MPLSGLAWTRMMPSPVLISSGIFSRLSKPRGGRLACWVCAMPSPVPRSCSRKSLYGWMTLLPSAAGTVGMSLPALPSRVWIAVPAGGVV